MVELDGALTRLKFKAGVHGRELDLLHGQALCLSQPLFGLELQIVHATRLRPASRGGAYPQGESQPRAARWLDGAAQHLQLVLLSGSEIDEFLSDDQLQANSIPTSNIHRRAPYVTEY
jgi:hypothetical protein